jgi:hypothetical protein
VKLSSLSEAPMADWSNATWKGSRRAQLRIALALSVRERLLAMQELAELSERLASMPRWQAPADEHPRP